MKIKVFYDDHNEEKEECAERIIAVDDDIILNTLLEEIPMYKFVNLVANIIECDSTDIYGIFSKSENVCIAEF
jgi:hypothetical protein